MSIRFSDSWFSCEFICKSKRLPSSWALICGSKSWRSVWLVCCVASASASASALACNKEKQSEERIGDKANELPDASGDPGKHLPEPAVLLAAHVEAAGGKAAADSIKSLYIESSIDVDEQNLHGTAKVWWSINGFYTEEAIPGLGITRAGSDGTVYWADDPVAHLRELSGSEAEQYQWASNVFLATDWRSHFPKAETIGIREVEGKQLVDVKLETKLGEQVTMTFDQNSHLLVRQKFEQIGPTGKVPVEVVLSDYRPVSGYLFAHHIKTNLSIITAVQTYKKIEANVLVDISKFKIPESHSVVPADPAHQAPAPVQPDKPTRKK